MHALGYACGCVTTGRLGGSVCGLADQRSTVAVAGGHKVAGHVAAEQRDVGHVRAVADGEGAAGMVGVGRIAQRRIRAETDVVVHLGECAPRVPVREQDHRRHPTARACSPRPASSPSYRPARPFGRGQVPPRREGARSRLPRQSPDPLSAADPDRSDKIKWNGRVRIGGFPGSGTSSRSARRISPATRRPPRKRKHVTVVLRYIEVTPGRSRSVSTGRSGCTSRPRPSATRGASGSGTASGAGSAAAAGAHHPGHLPPRRDRDGNAATAVVRVHAK